MSRDITGVVTWLKGWFYDKSEVNTYLNAKANKNLTNANMNVVTDSSGNITTEAKPTIPDVSGKIDTAGTGLSKTGTTLNHSNSIAAQNSAVLKKIKYDAQGHITGTANVDENDLPMHAHSADLIVDTNTNNYSNIGITNPATQMAINTAINTTIGNLSSFKAIEVVSTKPTASASTMNKLYIVSENGKVNVYYTNQSGSSYSWQKMDADILDELSISWNDLTDKPFTSVDTALSTSSTNPVRNSAVTTAINGKANTSHAHGYLSNDGKIGSASSLVVTDASRNLVTVEAVPSGYIMATQAYGNIGTAVGDALTSILFKINEVLGNKANSNHAHSGYATTSDLNGKQNVGDCITSIVLVPKSSDATGAIRLYYGDEPSS